MRGIVRGLACFDRERERTGHRRVGNHRRVPRCARDVAPDDATRCGPRSETRWEHPVATEPLWIVRADAEHHLHDACRLVLEDGTEFGVVDRLPTGLPFGYHWLEPVNGAIRTRLVCTPDRCPAAPEGWGVACQLYATMSASSQGIGDLADLAVLARWVASVGGSSVLLSPLHAPSPAFPQLDSPYSPASRVWRNPLHLRVEGVPPSRPEPHRPRRGLAGRSRRRSGPSSPAGATSRTGRRGRSPVPTTGSTVGQRGARRSTTWATPTSIAGCSGASTSSSLPSVSAAPGVALDRRPRDRIRPDRRRCPCVRRRHRDRLQRRRPAGSLQPGRPELGSAAVRAVAAQGGALRAVHPHDQGRAPRACRACGWIT